MHRTLRLLVAGQLPSAFSFRRLREPASFSKRPCLVEHPPIAGLAKPALLDVFHAVILYQDIGQLSAEFLQGFAKRLDRFGMVGT
jgi:hypothetical protein